MRSPRPEIERRGRARVLVAIALVAAGIGGCVPQPRSFVADPGLVPVLAAGATRTDSTGADSTHSERLAPGQATVRIAALPLANYSPARDGSDRLAPMLAAELGAKPGVEVADQGEVEAALEKEPWLLLDRLPPDLVDRLGNELNVRALLVGSLLAYGYREGGSERVPQVSLALRLMECPGGRVLWSGVHSRDGADAEWLFGFGRVQSLEQLAARTVHEVLVTLPAPAGTRPAERAQGGKKPS